LNSKIGDIIPTFEPFLGDQLKTPWYQRRALKVVVADISRKEMLVLPDDLDDNVTPTPKDFSVAEAVRLSMTIPLFFVPGTLNRATPLGKPEISTSTIVDGGILSNFPLWIYDAPPNQRPKCPTFGFQLTEHGVSEVEEDINCKPPEKENSADDTSEFKGAFDVLGGVLETMMVGRDRRHLRLNDQGRVLSIYTLGVPTTDFNLSPEKKGCLYAQGYRVARKFLETWSWEDHLEKRGFPKAVVSSESQD